MASLSPVSFTAPTDYSTEQQSIERRRKLAEALQTQGMSPMEMPQTPQGGFTPHASWTQGAAKMAQAYVGALGQRKADERQSALAQRYQSDAGSDVQRLVSAMGGRQAQTIQPDPQEASQSADYGTPEVGPVNLPAQTPTQSLQDALPQMRTPMGQQLGAQFLGQQIASMAPKRPEPFTLKPGEVRYDANQQPVAFGPDEKPSAPTPFNLSPGQTRYDASGKPVVSAPDKPAEQTPVTPVTVIRPDGRAVVIDARTGRELGISPQDTKLTGAFNADSAQLQGTVAGLDRLATSANQLLKHPGLAGITGFRGKIPNVPGSEAADAQALLNTLKSQVGFGVLQDMRNASKTGGALGNVSDAEGKRLEANLAALENAQSLPAFKKSLQQILGYSEQAKDRMREAFNLKHGGAGGLPTRPGESPQQPTQQRAGSGYSGPERRVSEADPLGLRK